jgi:hypothetical protein
MKTKLVLMATVLVLPLATAILAEPPQQDSYPAKSLAAQRGWVRFGVVVGRLRVLNAQFGQSLSTHTEDPETGVHESFSINVGSQGTTVHYEINTPDVQLTADFRGRDRLELLRTPRTPAGGEALRLVQSPRGPIFLTVGQGPQARHLRSDSFWHLMIEHREVCETHLLPVLYSLRPDWQLGATADEIEAGLLQLAAAGRLPQTQHWAGLVRQLGHGTFNERRAAERELRKEGPAVVAYLKSLDPRNLDMEQRQRIRRVVAGLVSHTEDTPERVALWLTGDESAWLAILSREDAASRKLAAAHLARLRGKPVVFDPDTPSADGPIRTATVPGSSELR